MVLHACPAVVDYLIQRHRRLPSFNAHHADKEVDATERGSGFEEFRVIGPYNGAVSAAGLLSRRLRLVWTALRDSKLSSPLQSPLQKIDSGDLRDMAAESRG